MLQLVGTVSSISQKKVYTELSIKELSILNISVGDLELLVISSQKLIGSEVLPAIIFLAKLEYDSNEYIISLLPLLTEFANECEEAPQPINEDCGLVAAQQMYLKVLPFWDHQLFFQKYRQLLYNALDLSKLALIKQSTLYLNGQVIYKYAERLKFEESFYELSFKTDTMQQLQNLKYYLKMFLE